MNKLSIHNMFLGEVHFGHQSRFLNHKMRDFIFCTKNKINIINLEKTLEYFKKAQYFIKNVISNNGKILLVGTKYCSKDIIKSEAIRCNMPYIHHRWIGGILTNYKTVKKNIDKMKNLENLLSDKEKISNFTKKEYLKLQKTLNKLNRNIGGIKNMEKLPDAIFVSDVQYNDIAIKEAKILNIPIIGIVDTNNSPENINYIIPGNDDSLKANYLYISSIADTILEVTDKK